MSAGDLYLWLWDFIELLLRIDSGDHLHGNNITPSQAMRVCGGRSLLPSFICVGCSEHHYDIRLVVWGLLMIRLGLPWLHRCHLRDGSPHLMIWGDPDLVCHNPSRRLISLLYWPHINWEWRPISHNQSIFAMLRGAACTVWLWSRWRLKLRLEL